MTPLIQQLLREALSHQHSGRIDEALVLFLEILDHDPVQPQAHFSLGIAAYQSGDLNKAITHLEKAAKRAKKHPQVFQLLGLAQLNAANFDKARAALRQAVILAPKNADFHAQLGDVYRLQRKAVLARASYNRSLALESDNSYGLIGMGQLEVSLGHISEAIRWFKQAVSAGKQLPTAYHRLAFTNSQTEPTKELDDVKKLIETNDYSHPTEIAELHWAAGKMYDDLDDTPNAATHFRQARRLHYQPFDVEAYRDRIAFFREVFSPDFFHQRAGIGLTSQKPVFIFGMPRSGTTLIEQILARHTRFASGGEITFFRALQDNLGLKGTPSAKLQRSIENLDRKDYQRLAAKYLQTLNAVDRRAWRITDKMPHNYEMVWMMMLLFPNATFIHCTRSPADTCVSLISHALSPAHNYCSTQKTVGAYYRQYQQLMDHWNTVLPGNLRHQSYEGLVYQQEEQSRALVTQTGLDWEEACLEFYKGDTPVTTFSDTQVRRPIFRSSIDRWKKHQDYLTDLFEALGPSAPEEMISGQQNPRLSGQASG